MEESDKQLNKLKKLKRQQLKLLDAVAQEINALKLTVNALRWVLTAIQDIVLIQIVGMMENFLKLLPREIHIKPLDLIRVRSADALKTDVNKSIALVSIQVPNVLQRANAQTVKIVLELVATTKIKRTKFS